MNEYKIRLPDNLVFVVEKRKERESLDEASVLRLLINDGAKEFVLELYSEGEISLGKAAEVLNCTPHDIIRMVQQKRIRTGPRSEQVAKSGGILEKLTESV